MFIILKGYMQPNLTCEHDEQSYIIYIILSLKLLLKIHDHQLRNRSKTHITNKELKYRDSHYISKLTDRNLR